jgi:CHAD domain-containing protein
MEIEAKFALPGADILAALARAEVLAGFSLGSPEVVKVRDEYVDTAGGHLRAAGYYCRVRRQSDGGVRLTLKSITPPSADIHRREEYETVLPTMGAAGTGSGPAGEGLAGAGAGAVAGWPEGELRSRVLGLVGYEPLVPLVELVQVRTVRLVSDNERVVAELSLDAVTVVVGGGNGAYHEVEAELRPDGAEEQLAAIAAALRDEWGLVAEPRSKFERALEVVDAVRAEGDAPVEPEKGAPEPELAPEPEPEPAPVALAEIRRRAAAKSKAGALVRLLEQPMGAKPGVDPDDTMAVAAGKVLAFHFVRMLKHEDGTRLGEDVEELHDMRVSTRRMRAALRVFGGHLDMKHMRPLLRGLQRTGRTLGTIRDLDVFREKTELYLDTLPEERRYELDPLMQVWADERDRARGVMTTYLDSGFFARFKEDFASFLEDPEQAALPLFAKDGSPLAHRVRHVVPSVVYERVGAVRAYDEWVGDAEVPLERLHQLRISAKAMRYTLEFFQEVLGSQAKTLIEEVKDLQDHLGDMQDAVVTCGVLHHFLSWGDWVPVDEQQVKRARPTVFVVSPGVATYLAERQRELETLIATFPQTWERIDGPEFVAKVAAAVSIL